MGLRTVLSQQLVFALLGLGIAMWFGVWDSSILRPHWWVIVTGVIFGVGLIALAELFTRLFPVVMDQIEQAMLQTWSKIKIRWTWLTVVSLSVAAGVGEELLFRAALQGVLVAHLPLLVALVLASLLFGLAHWISLAYVLVIAALGLVFGLVYHFTSSLLLVIIGHTVYDIYALRQLGDKLAVMRQAEQVKY